MLLCECGVVADGFPEGGRSVKRVSQLSWMETVPSPTLHRMVKIGGWGMGVDNTPFLGHLQGKDSGDNPYGYLPEGHTIKRFVWSPGR